MSLNEDNRNVVCLTGVDLCKGLDGLCGMKIRRNDLAPPKFRTLGEWSVSQTGKVVQSDGIGNIIFFFSG